MKKTILFIAAVLAAALLTVGALYYFGVLHLNNPNKNKYPVRGVDVSSYQGEIDWNVLSSQNISFAYIKATEGSSYQDPRFSDNWSAAAETTLRIGAYHFFSFESSGKTQAENFIKTVTPVSNMLPPAIDVEFYGKFSKDNIDSEKIAKDLREAVDILTEKYEMKPVIYVTEDSFNSIVSGKFEDCDIWFRSVYGPADDGVKWTFWQYSNRHRIKGYNGKEPYIDMNVFSGSADEFQKYPNK